MQSIVAYENIVLNKSQEEDDTLKTGDNITIHAFFTFSYIHLNPFIALTHPYIYIYIHTPALYLQQTTLHF